MTIETKKEKDRRLIQASILHWKEMARDLLVRRDSISRGDYVHYPNADQCALCHEYLHGIGNPYGSDCDGCPVKEWIGAALCRHSAYSAAVEGIDTVRTYNANPRRMGDTVVQRNLALNEVVGAMNDIHDHIYFLYSLLEDCDNGKE